MLFKAAILIIFLIYIRPQEWRDWVAKLHPVHLVILIAMWGVLTDRRDTKFSLKSFFKAPHDVLLLLFYSWIIYADWQPFDVTFDPLKILLLFYFIVVLSMDSFDKVEKFMKAWVGFILAIAMLAVLGEFGFDPLHSTDITNGPMQGRLVVRLSLFNNPNALGHSIIPLIPVAYYMYWWKRPPSNRVWYPLMMAAPLICLYMTKSRGSFLAGTILVSLSFMFGRPKVLQVLMVLVFFVGAPALLSRLPRMDSPKAISQDKGVEGRLIAFEWGLEQVRIKPHGVGFNQFIFKFYEDKKYFKDSHSAYVHIGAELGWKGLFLYVAMLYACLRTIVTANSETDQQERIRRALFCFVVGWCFSSWMINIAYNPIFLLILGTSSAYHRLMHMEFLETSRRRNEAKQPKNVAGERLKQQHALSAATATAMGPGHPGGAGPMVMAMGTSAPALVDGPLVGSQARQASGMLKDQLPKVFGVGWRRFGLIDFVLVYLLTTGVVRIWAYVVERYYAH